MMELVVDVQRVLTGISIINGVAAVVGSVISVQGGGSATCVVMGTVCSIVRASARVASMVKISPV